VRWCFERRRFALESGRRVGGFVTELRHGILVRRPFFRLRP
jgi:hypothetical protein